MSSGYDKLRVGLVCPGWPPSEYANGIVTYVDAISRGLARHGVEPVILAGKIRGHKSNGMRIKDRREYAPAASLWERGVRRFGLERSRQGLLSRRIGEGVARAAEAAKCDLIEIEETWGWSRHVAAATSIPVIVRLHGPWFLSGTMLKRQVEKSFKARIGWEKEGLLQAVAVTSPSNDVLEKTQKFYGIHLPRSAVIANPIATTAQDRCWRQEEADPNLMLFVGRFDRLKGGDLVLRAMASILRDHPEATLKYVGPDQGFQGDDGVVWSIQDYLKHVISDEAIRCRVDIMGRRRPEDISVMRRQSGFAIVASRYENFPYSVLEAMSSGTPLVASRIGGIAEMIVDGKQGLLFTPEDVPDLISRSSELLSNPGRAAELGAAARARSESEYSEDAIAKRMAEFYAELIRRPSAGQVRQEMS